ncbi:unnamed protein product [Lampetra planeri]
MVPTWDTGARPRKAEDEEMAPLAVTISARPSSACPPPVRSPAQRRPPESATHRPAASPPAHGQGEVPPEAQPAGTQQAHLTAGHCPPQCRPS